MALGLIFGFQGKTSSMSKSRLRSVSHKVKGLAVIDWLMNQIYKEHKKKYTSLCYMEHTKIEKKVYYRQSTIPRPL